MLLINHRRRGAALDDRVDEAALTPMIDIFFQLLVFFLLTMQFREAEGKLLSQLPSYTLGPSTIAEGIRIVIWADGDVQPHPRDRNRYYRGANRSNSKCVVQLEEIRIGEVFLTETQPDAAKGNQKVYGNLGKKAAELRDRLSKFERFAPVILGADPDVPYEHIVGILNGCKEHGIHDVKLAANGPFEGLFR